MMKFQDVTYKEDLITCPSITSRGCYPTPFSFALHLTVAQLGSPNGTLGMSMRRRGSNHQTRTDRLYSGWDLDKAQYL